jgi:outer membrane protein OmpA-like peptidoglycan-associated protein
MAMSQYRTLHKGLANARNLGGRACCIAIGAMLLASCSSPPKPPSVDESTKRPVNARAAVDLKACQGDLSRATILLSEMARAGVVATASTKALPLPGAEPASVVDPRTTDAPANQVAVVPFGMGSAAWSVEQADSAALVRRAKDAAVIMIRGRTDAAGDSLQETALARRRAEAAAEFLQQAGVSRDKLRLTWQGAGDPVAGLRPSDRAQSRRVEIEFYTAAPMLVSVRSGDIGNARNTLDSRAKGPPPAPDRVRSTAAASL